MNSGNSAVPWFFIWSLLVEIWFFDMNWRRRVCSRPAAFFEWDILKRSEAWKIFPWLRLIFSDMICMNAHVIARVICIYPLHCCHVGLCLHHKLSTMHGPWLSHCTSPWLCMNCWKSSKHLYIGACWCPQEAVMCPLTMWLERPTLRDERYVKKLSNLLCLTRCGYYDHLEEDGQLYPNMTT